MQETTETNCSQMNFLQFDNAVRVALFSWQTIGGGDFISQRQRWRGVFAPAKSET